MIEFQTRIRNVHALIGRAAEHGGRVVIDTVDHVLRVIVGESEVLHLDDDSPWVIDEDGRITYPPND